MDAALGEQIRASFLLAGPLLARFGRAEMPPPGGDFIGRRRLDPHLDAFEELGAACEFDDGVFILRAEHGLQAGEVLMDEPSVMATENVLMAAALTPGCTVIHNAACEPHVQDLARLLVKMGADVQGIGSNLLTVNGCEHLGGATPRGRPRPHRDRQLHGARRRHRRRAADHRHDPARPADDLPRLRGARPLQRVRRNGRHRARRPAPRRQARLRRLQAQVLDGPWPAFPADLTSVAVALATQAEGSVLIHEWMFESRLVFTDKLAAMGADIVLCDPHRAIVTGPRRLRGERLVSPDIRAGMAMLIAALCAEGRSEIGNASEIDRGYERIDERLRLLGAQIEREPAPCPPGAASLGCTTVAGAGEHRARTVAPGA